MGYTHYFTPRKEKTEDQWYEFCSAARKLIDASTAVIRDGWGEGTPDIDDDCLGINGDESNGLAHETFQIKREDNKWDFCKTAMKPYDEVVVALLIIGERIGIIKSWSSDGERKDFEDAYTLIDKAGLDR